MANVGVRQNRISQSPLRWRELWLKEDWLAIWLGLGIVVLASAFFVHGASIRWIAVTPAKWSTWSQLGSHFAGNYERYIAQFLVWLGIFAAALTTLSFAFLYMVAVAIFAIGQWDKANTYNLEPPLVALVVGMALSNLVGLRRWLDAGFRVEFYVKTGIVVLGATLPFTLIVWAGPVAILQASIVSVVTSWPVPAKGHSSLLAPVRSSTSSLVCFSQRSCSQRIGRLWGLDRPDARPTEPAPETSLSCKTNGATLRSSVDIAAIFAMTPPIWSARSQASRV